MSKDDLSSLSSHVLDLDQGGPASGMLVSLRQAGGEHSWLAQVATDADGRITNWGLDGVSPGDYELCFAVREWYEERSQSCFYPHVCIAFSVAGGQHYHVPLLINRHGYSTYRGS